MDYFELFDRGIDRHGTGCEKWDDLKESFGREDITPLWVADMDFEIPAQVAEAIRRRAEHAVYGYEMADPDNVSAVVDWLARRHKLTVERDWVSFGICVVQSMRAAIGALTQPGDLVAVQPPVYQPFYTSVEVNGREIYRNRLVQTDEGWKMNLDDLERGLKMGVRAVLICSPHNPVGRVWTRDELSDLAALCSRYGAVIIADEIHSDIIMPGYRHTPIIEASDRAVMLISATKSFNLAALRHSSSVIPNDDLRARFRDEVNRRGIGVTNLYGALAQRAAYEHGAPWLDALCEYIDINRRLVADYLSAELPYILPSRLEGSYLQWLDFRALKLSDEDLMSLMVGRAGVGLIEGPFFGEEGSGFMRMNLASPRSYIERALEGMKAALPGRPV